MQNRFVLVVSLCFITCVFGFLYCVCIVLFCGNLVFGFDVHTWDAPGLVVDFYLNLLDWSSQNILAVGLDNCVYIKNFCGSKVTKLYDLGENDSVCSVGWDPCGTNLAVGTSEGKV